MRPPRAAPPPPRSLLPSYSRVRRSSGGVDRRRQPGLPVHRGRLAHRQRQHLAAAGRRRRGRGRGRRRRSAAISSRRGPGRKALGRAGGGRQVHHERCIRAWRPQRRAGAHISPRRPARLASPQSVAGPHVACGHRDGSIHVFDLREQRLLHKLAPHSLPVRSLRFTRDGKTLVTASDDGQVKLIDMCVPGCWRPAGAARVAVVVQCSPVPRNAAHGGAGSVVRKCTPSQGTLGGCAASTSATSLLSSPLGESR